MKKAFCLLNHKLTENQTAELMQNFGVEVIVEPEPFLTEKWAQIPAESSISFSVINLTLKWLENCSKGDLLIVQGEFGHTFLLVDYALKSGLVPLHAVSKRIEKEICEGEKITKQHIFQHVCFRKYMHFDETLLSSVIAKKSTDDTDSYR